MADRVGTRMRDAGPLPATLLGEGDGEDWVVPRSGVRYLLAQEIRGGGLLSVYDAAGRLVGERCDPSFERLAGMLDALWRKGRAERPSSIPPEVSGALAYLDAGPRRRPDS